MSKLMEYRVLRAHDGDRFYHEGEIRTAREVDVKHLLPNTLEPVGDAPEPPAEKAEPPVQNKAEPPVVNKAEPTIADKAEALKSPRRK
jgi:hypothetical protein